VARSSRISAAKPAEQEEEVIENRYRMPIRLWSPHPAASFRGFHEGDQLQQLLLGELPLEGGMRSAG
jgi:hypothetical protein